MDKHLNQTNSPSQKFQQLTNTLPDAMSELN